MSTDRELLEMAAKAAEMNVSWLCSDEEMDYQPDVLAKSEGMFLNGDRSPDNSKFWDPLADDGDALRLAVKLRLSVRIWPDRVCVDTGSPGFCIYAEESVYPDRHAQATRRAIVRAAAQIGRAKPKAMKHATATLNGALLDAAVAKALYGRVQHVPDDGWYFESSDPKRWPIVPPYSTDWAHGGPLIEVHEISLTHRGLMEWFADAPGSAELGPTPLIAAMRALVASKLGDEVEL